MNLAFDFLCICTCMCALRFDTVRSAPHQVFLSVDDFSGSWCGKLKDLLCDTVLVLQWSQRGKWIRQTLFKVRGCFLFVCFVSVLFCFAFSHLPQKVCNLHSKVLHFHRYVREKRRCEQFPQLVFYQGPAWENFVSFEEKRMMVSWWEEKLSQDSFSWE